MRKLFDNISAQESLVAEAYTGATTGATVIDTQGYSDAMLLAVAGDITCTTGDTYRILLMECDTSDGTFASTGIYVDYTGASGAAALQNTCKQARVAELNVARKRFLRVDLALTATTSAWEGAGVLILGGKVSGPINSD
jgi:hypothetical protein